MVVAKVKVLPLVKILMLVVQEVVVPMQILAMEDHLPLAVVMAKVPLQVTMRPHQEKVQAKLLQEVDPRVDQVMELAQLKAMMHLHQDQEMVLLLQEEMVVHPPQEKEMVKDKLVATMQMLLVKVLAKPMQARELHQALEKVKDRVQLLEKAPMHQVLAKERAQLMLEVVEMEILVMKILIQMTILVVLHKVIQTLHSTKHKWRWKI